MALARILLTFLIIISLNSFLFACSKNPRGQTVTKDGVPYGNVDVSKIPNAVPKVEAKSTYGNPTSYVAAGHRYYVLNNATGYSQKGLASWYGRGFQNQLTSSHERYNPWAMTAASRNLPIPTYVQVTNLENGRQVIVKVNDRGPFAQNRIIDLSYAAAAKLGYAGKGTALVKVSAIDVKQFYAAAKSNSYARTMANARSRQVALASTSTKNPTKTTTKISSNSVTHAPILASVSNHRQLYVQVGAFEKYTTAEAIKHSVDHLTQYSTRIATVAAAGQTVYRVQIGPLKSSQQSSQLYRTLHQHGFNKAITVLG